MWVCTDADTAYIHSFEAYIHSFEVCTGRLDLRVEHDLAYNDVMHLLRDLLDSG